MFNQVHFRVVASAAAPQKILVLVALLLLGACVSVDEKRKALQAKTDSDDNAAANLAVEGDSNIVLELRGERSEIDTGLPTALARKALIGKWYGMTETRGGGRKEWLVERAADGTYRTDFHTVASDGAVRSQSEVGFWGVSGDIYFRIFRGWVMLDGMKLANPGDPGHYDAYHVEMLNSGHFRYRHVETGRVYTVRKMPKDFSLPIVLDERNDSPLKFEF